MLRYVPREKIPKLLEICNSKGTAIKKADSQKLLGVIFGHNINFKEHIKTICQMKGKKLNVLTGLSYLIALYQ